MPVMKSLFGASFDRAASVTLKEISSAAVTAAGATSETPVSLNILSAAYWDNNEIPDQAFITMLNVDAADAVSADEEYIFTYEVDTDSAFSSSDAQAWDQAWQEDADGGPSYVDETTDINDVGADDVALFPATVAANDSFYFGLARKFTSLSVTVGTAGVGTYDAALVWEYHNGSTWVNLATDHNLVDDTTAFKTAGTNSVTFDMPVDWEVVIVNSVSKYYVRARYVSGTMSTNPLVSIATANEVAAFAVATVVVDRDSAVDDYKTILDADTISKQFPGAAYMRITATLGGTTPSITYHSFFYNPVH